MELSKYFKSHSNFQKLTAGYEKQKNWEKNKHSVFHSMESLTFYVPFFCYLVRYERQHPSKPKPLTEKEIIIC